MAGASFACCPNWVAPTPWRSFQSKRAVLPFGNFQPENWFQINFFQQSQEKITFLPWGSPSHLRKKTTTNIWDSTFLSMKNWWHFVNVNKQLDFNHGRRVYLWFLLGQIHLTRSTVIFSTHLSSMWKRYMLHESCWSFSVAIPLPVHRMPTEVPGISTPLNPLPTERLALMYSRCFYCPDFHFAKVAKKNTIAPSWNIIKVRKSQRFGLFSRSVDGGAPPALVSVPSPTTKPMKWNGKKGWC